MRRSSLRFFAASSGPKVVGVTGANGYLGSFITAELLGRGYEVRAPVRGSSETPAKVAHLVALDGAERLRVFEGGDLRVSGSFDEAFDGCDAVINTAARVLLDSSKETVDVSVAGVQNVLRSLPSTVTRFVQTSSIAAIQRYDKPRGYKFSERDWNDWSRADDDAYGFAKTRAELAVVDFCESNGVSYAALNPSIVIGPVMTKQHTKASPIFLRNIIFGNKILNAPSNFVDVRDVATAHVEALERLDTIQGPRRFVLTSDAPCADATELANVANRVLPQFRFVAKPMYDHARMTYLYMPLSRLPFIGRFVMSEFQRLAFSTPINFDNSHAKTQLGIAFRPLEDTVREGLQSIIDAGIAKPAPRS
ncbi:hypothetical protein CTAYLR_009003 [Chrysophaeum taylorii]|uniref:NAD-dependent epimerase/dehydratase domain-containing protein n=1 Tax=Chrysophaeum taylorii TaxID=2483200 RepID=A0AAD7XQM1_9STRA|nr:hypothetical protein CTAYLR_009003 [Chrysophaeum taylorii]